MLTGFCYGQRHMFALAILLHQPWWQLEGDGEDGAEMGSVLHGGQIKPHNDHTSLNGC